MAEFFCARANILLEGKLVGCRVLCTSTMSVRERERERERQRQRQTDRDRDKETKREGGEIAEGIVGY